MSTLAEQLAPHAQPPDPEAWRALMKPNELRAYDAGKYDELHEKTDLDGNVYRAKDLSKAPRESEQISRNNRLVPFLDKDSEDANANLVNAFPSPEDKLQVSETIRGFELIVAISEPCNGCGQNLLGQGEDRDMIVRTRSGNTTAFVYCPGCSYARHVELESDPWFSSQPESDRKIWQLHTEGLTQREIAKELSVPQQTVSLVLTRLVEHFARNRKQTRYNKAVENSGRTTP
jgi:hypothetical protein